MKQDELRLLHDYLDGTITDADFAKLQTLLRESAEARRMLRGLATVDAKLQELGALNANALTLLTIPTIPAARMQPRHPWLAWGSLAAAACVALGLLAMRFVRVNPPPSRPDVASAIIDSQKAIAGLSIKLPEPIPLWTSPTASLLDEPRIPQ